MRPATPRAPRRSSTPEEIRVRKLCCVERLELDRRLAMPVNPYELLRIDRLLAETEKTATRHGPWTEIHVARGATEADKQALIRKTEETECGVCAGIREDALLTEEEKRARAKAQREMWGP